MILCEKHVYDRVEGNNNFILQLSVFRVNIKQFTISEWQNNLNVSFISFKSGTDQR